jgi:hypothetical protein
MRIDDAEPAQWVVVINDEYEPTVHYFITKLMAEKFYEEYKKLRNEVILAQIVAQIS